MPTMCLGTEERKVETKTVNENLRRCFADLFLKSQLFFPRKLVLKIYVCQISLVWMKGMDGGAYWSMIHIPMLIDYRQLYWQRLKLWSATMSINFWDFPMTWNWPFPQFQWFFENGSIMLNFNSFYRHKFDKFHLSRKSLDNYIKVLCLLFKGTVDLHSYILPIYR